MDDTTDSEETGELQEDNAEVKGEDTLAEGNSEQTSPDHGPEGLLVYEHQDLDYLPSYTHQYPEELDPRMDEHLDNLNAVLRYKEGLKLAVLDRGINRSYYKMWIEDANNVFRTMISIRNRRKKTLAARNSSDLEKADGVETTEDLHQGSESPGSETEVDESKNSEEI